MTTVNVTWTTQDEVVPNAAIFNQYDVQLQDVNGNVIQDATEPFGSTSHSFLSVVPGDYIAYVADVDPAGNLAAPAVTAAFTVPAEATTPVPVTISVSLA